MPDHVLGDFGSEPTPPPKKTVNLGMRLSSSTTVPELSLGHSWVSRFMGAEFLDTSEDVLIPALGFQGYQRMDMPQIPDSSSPESHCWALIPEDISLVKQIASSKER